MCIIPRNSLVSLIFFCFFFNLVISIFSVLARKASGAEVVDEDWYEEKTEFGWEPTSLKAFCKKKYIN